MQILIVEDEIIIAEMLKMMLQKMGYSVIGTCRSFKEFELFVEDKTPDLVLLDINLQDDKDGIHLAEICHKRNLPFVFITSYSDKHTIQQAMEFDPLGYMLKPFTERELEKTIEVVKAKVGGTKNVLYLKDGHNYIKLMVAEIKWLQAENVYTEIHTDSKKILHRISLKEMIEMLPKERFARVHRSYVVNISRISKVSSNHVLIAEEKVPLSRTFKAELLKTLM